MTKNMFVEDYVRRMVSKIIDDAIIVVDDNNIVHVGGHVIDKGRDENGAHDIDFVLDSVFTGNYFEKVVVHDPVRAGVRRIDGSTGEITNDVSDKHYWYSWCKLSGLRKKANRVTKFW